jgi:hypothetical protein
MKPSSEWVRQPMVDEVADAIVAGGKVTLATITAYQVAAKLDCDANPSLYAKFRDWRARREAETAPATIDVPPEIEAGIRGIFDRLSGEGITACLDAVRTVGSNLDRVAMLRVTVAERRAEIAEAEVTTVLVLGEKAENELRAANIRIGELEQALAEAQRREDRLTGRLEQCEADLAAAPERYPRNDVQKADSPTGDATDDAGSGAGDAGDAADICSMRSAAATHAAQLLLTFNGVAGESTMDQDARHD